MCTLGSRAVVALLVATGAAGGANDNHATAFAAVLVGGHFDGEFLVGFALWFGVRCESEAQMADSSE